MKKWPKVADIVSQKRNSKVLICSNKSPIYKRNPKSLYFPPSDLYPNLAKSSGACLPPPSNFTNLKNKKTRVFGRYLILIIPNGSSFYYYFRIREALVLRVYWGKKRLENHHFRLFIKNLKEQVILSVVI
jgi:hypothetical protein